jgi:hypothetical protein
MSDLRRSEYARLDECPVCDGRVETWTDEECGGEDGCACAFLCLDCGASYHALERLWSEFPETTYGRPGFKP